MHNFEYPFKVTFQAMACHCEVVICLDPALPGLTNLQKFPEYDLNNSQHLALLLPELVGLAIAEVQRIEWKFSRYRSDSIVSRINAAAGLDAISCDNETWGLLLYAAQLYESSGGLFDISAGVLRQAWNFKQAQLPERQQLAKLLPFIGWQRIQLDAAQQQIFLPDAGMEIDFGGFGKEYAADRAAEILASYGVRYGYVNLGGDVRVLGPKLVPKQAISRVIIDAQANKMHPAQIDFIEQAWMMGIQDPRNKGQLLASIPVLQGGLATSGDYERYFDLDGRRYCHIMHPASGYPVQYWRSVSVLAPLAVMAGHLSTIAMLKQADAIAYLEASGMKYLALDQQQNVFMHKSA